MKSRKVLLGQGRSEQQLESSQKIGGLVGTIVVGAILIAVVVKFLVWFYGLLFSTALH